MSKYSFSALWSTVSLIQYIVSAAAAVAAAVTQHSKPKQWGCFWKRGTRLKPRAKQKQNHLSRGIFQKQSDHKW